jgi:hypothetical protein
MESAFSVESGKMDATTKHWLIVSSALVGSSDAGFRD